MKFAFAVLLSVFAGHVMAEASVSHVCLNPNDHDNTQGTLTLLEDGRAGAEYVRKGATESVLAVTVGVDTTMVETMDRILVVNRTSNNVSIFSKPDNNLTGVLTCAAVDPSTTFEAKGIAGAGDILGAEESATSKAEAQCAPLAAIRTSAWEEGNTGRYVYAYAKAQFQCRTK